MANNEIPECPFDDLESQLNTRFLQGLAGDATAYHQFLATLTPYLRRFVRRRWRWPDTVEDRVQDILLAIHQQRATYNPALPLTAWLHAIAKYKLIDAHRRYQRRDAPLEGWDDSELATQWFAASEDAPVAAAQWDVATLLARLPPMQRRVLVAVKLEGCTIAEAATQTGLSPSAIKTTVHRGLRTLMSLLPRDAAAKKSRPPFGEE